MAFPASGQTPDIGQQHAPAHGSFIAGYARSASSGLLAGRWITEFHRGPAPEFRLSARRALDAVNGQEQVRWIDETTCPGLAPTLEALDGLVMPTVNVPNLARQPAPVPVFPGPTSIPTDAPAYTIFALGRQPDGNFADLRVSSISGLIAGWGQFADRLLEPCWRAAPVSER